jgi:hypothetical protein
MTGNDHVFHMVLFMKSLENTNITNMKGTAIISIVSFEVITPCGMISSYLCCEGTYCLYCHDRASTLKTVAEVVYEHRQNKDATWYTVIFVTEYFTNPFNGSVLNEKKFLLHFCSHHDHQSHVT